METEKILIAEIEDLTERVDNNTNVSQALLDNLEHKERELERLCAEKANVSYLRNRIEWLEKSGEINQIFFKSAV